MDTKAIRAWMRQQLDNPSGDYDEPFDSAGEPDCTTLAEQAANEFSLHEFDSGTIPEEVFELAFEVAEAWKRASPKDRLGLARRRV
jgi:hypothetical protein